MMRIGDPKFRLGKLVSRPGALTGILFRNLFLENPSNGYTHRHQPQRRHRAGRVLH
jgi:hypothetical protein